MLVLYQNIKNRRKANGWNQTELAKRAGYSDKSMIAKIEAGKVDLPQSKIETFAEIFGCTVSELMGYTADNIIMLDGENLANKIYRLTNGINKDGTPFGGIGNLFSKEEFDLIREYRTLNSEEKRMLIEMLAFFKSKKQD